MPPDARAALDIEHDAVVRALRGHLEVMGVTTVAAVEREAGPRGIDAAWRGPEYLPSVDELSRPLDWLARVDRS